MRKLAILGAAIAALTFTAPAHAADMPIKGPYYTAHNWSGFYIGAHVGYGWGDVSGLDVDGAFGGAQLGVNWQVSPRWVLGLEADISASDIGVGAAKVDWFGTVRGRIGYTWDRMMLYGTGGIAFADTNFNASFVGWTLGFGLEWVFAPRWSAKIEYLYIDFGDEVIPLFVAPATLDTSIVRFGVNYRF